MGFRRRAAPLLVLAGLGGALLVITPHVPVERHVTLQLEEPSSITGLALTWERRSPGGAEAAVPVRAISWNFAEGAAPKALDQVTPLADGIYDVDVTVERGRRRDASHRVVVLGSARRVAIPVR